MNDKITRTLTDQAERFSQQHHSDLSLDGVLARAGEIRRGRRMRATMAMAAVVLAVAVPVGVTVLGDDAPGGGRDVPPATQTPVNTDPLTLEGLNQGEAPKVPYWLDSSLGGGGTPTGLAQIEGGFLVARSDGNTTKVSFLSDDRSDLGTTWPVDDSSFAVSPDGNVGAFVETNGTVIAVQDGGSRWFEVGKVPGAAESAGPFRAAAVTGEDCSGRSEEVGCTVYVESTGEKPVIGAVSPHRDPVLVHPALRRLDGIAPNGDVAGMTSVTDSSSCSAVLDKADVLQWRTCDHQFLGYSPDGKHLLATIPSFDGAGTSSLTVLDAATDRVVLDLRTADQGVLAQWSWEDDSHLIVALLQGRGAALVRIGLDGHRELAAPVQSASDFVSPYLLATH